jgi:hypothetical protein
MTEAGRVEKVREVLKAGGNQVRTGSQLPLTRKLMDSARAFIRAKPSKIIIRLQPADD